MTDVITPLQLDVFPDAVIEISQKLKLMGFRSWIVGGCVRDILRGSIPKDWDMCTDALPTDVQRIFSNTIPTGIEHGTITVRIRGESYELTTLRGDGAYTDGRRPDSVTFVTDLTEDLARRDFTINAMAVDPLTRQLFDPFNGTYDLGYTIRAVGVAADRFNEDGLRILRAVRFAAGLSHELDMRTQTAIVSCRSNLKNVSAERVYTELKKMCESSNGPAFAFRRMYDLGILEVLGCPISNDKIEECLTLMDTEPAHACVVLPFERALAALFRHTSIKDANTWLHNLRCTTRERLNILHFMEVLQGSESREVLLNDPHKLRIWGSQAGREHLDTLLSLQFGWHDYSYCTSVLDTAVLSTRELVVNGHDILAQGVQPKAVGQVLQNLLRHCLEDPSNNTRASLLAKARQVG